MRLPIYFTFIALLASFAQANTSLTISLTKPSPAVSDGLKIDSTRAPNGETLTFDSRSLILNGKRWTPAMGEFHFSRYPASEWRTELLKMKAGGIDIVATYVFWIHHEEEEGTWNWNNQRNLRQFVETAQSAGLKAVIRIGPWCHGEVRNGGIPDWVHQKGWRVRSNDEHYLASVRVLYSQIANQLKGLMWKEGGPVVGIQLDNEYKGPAEHLLSLKRIARDVGLEVPIYTRTGWDRTSTPMPFGEIVPLYGVYAEGFWDREITPMPGKYWVGFHFDDSEDNADGTQQKGRYPYLTCEIGGGMMSSYHRRILVDPLDIESTTLVKIGSGSSLVGYYMYHGGTNPEGKLSTLMETQNGGWNDLPVLNYDFQAPLGQFGQIRPHYFRLRRLHLFLRDFGTQLADTSTSFPDVRPAGKDDSTTLRWSARSDGSSGFVFVNNYERLKQLPTKKSVQFSLKLADGGSLTFPDRPVDIPANAISIWPFNLKLGSNLKLAWATAQPVSVDDDGKTRTYYFAETPGVRARFALATDSASLEMIEATPNHKPFVQRRLSDGRQVRIVLLSESDSLSLQKNSSEDRVRFEPLPRSLAGKSVAFKLIKEAGPVRQIPLGKARQPVAAAPNDTDFDQAVVWKIQLPANYKTDGDVLLRLNYIGDVARVFIGNEMILDDFYNGEPLDIGLHRFADALKKGELRIAILPLQRNAAIYFSSPKAKPDFGGRESFVELRSAELIRR